MQILKRETDTFSGILRTVIVPGINDKFENIKLNKHNEKIEEGLSKTYLQHNTRYVFIAFSRETEVSCSL